MFYFLECKKNIKKFQSIKNLNFYKPIGAFISKAQDFQIAFLGIKNCYSIGLKTIKSPKKMKKIKTLKKCFNPNDPKTL